MIELFKHLLPRAQAWSITIDKQLRRLFVGLSPSVDSLRTFFDMVWLDMFPATTRELTAWEAQFGLFRYNLSEPQRRERLAALWAATGGQSPRYIQDTLRNAGFDVYVHEWWEMPAAHPPVARNPFIVLGGIEYGCGDTLMECGELVAECGDSTEYAGWVLVNKLYNTYLNLTCLCGEAHMECGEALAACGENDGIIFERVQYAIPHDPAFWPYFIYIGGETFGTLAKIAADRFDELEDLILKIVPEHLWIIMLVDFQFYIIEDATLNYVIEDFSGDYLLEVL